MRQGNQQDYAYDDFGDSEGRGLFRNFDAIEGMTDFEDAVTAPVVRTTGDCVVVELGGDIDLLAFHRHAPLMDVVAAGPYRVVVVDLTEATFFDCSGLTLLVRAHRRATDRGGRVTVVCRHRLTLRLIELAGLTEMLAPSTTVEEALQ